jgi:DNA helicase II / ATP-dependent DNA helicase PcrA
MLAPQKVAPSVDDAIYQAGQDGPKVLIKKPSAPISALQIPHLVVEARAGTGKTTTLVEGLRYVMGGQSSMTPSPQQQAIWDCMALSAGSARSICFVAFNKSIADELRKRVPRGVEAKTMHGMGFTTILKAFPNLRNRELNSHRTADILAELCKIDRHTMRKKNPSLVNSVTELVSLCKINLIDRPQNEDDPDEWPLTIIRLAGSYDVNYGDTDPRELADIVSAILQVSRDPTRGGMIGYDDMIWLPVVLKLPIWKNDLLLVDERQDLNLCQMQLALMAGDRIIAVGDEKQSIYQFAGADSKACSTFKELLRNTGREVVELPLTVTRRCGHKIVEEAQHYVPDFSAHETCQQGAVNYNAKYSSAQAGDMVLCRNNAPLISACLRYIRNGKKATIRGRNIGEGLITLVEKMKADTIADLLKKIGIWAQSEGDKEKAKQDPSATVLANIFDKHECIHALCSELSSSSPASAAVDKINELFNDKSQGGIQLSSIHKAKGLEARKVFLLPHLPKKKLDDPAVYANTWIPDPSQEYNLLYVAITRAIEEFNYVAYP